MIEKRKVLMFDFDGVIVESVGIKGQAFLDLFREEKKEYQVKILRYHDEHSGLSRTHKIRYFYENIIHKPLSKKKLEDLENMFSVIVKERVIRAPYVTGVLEFIKTNFKLYDLYIISGTPENELKEIVEKRGLSSYFIDIYGSPIKKYDAINKIISERKHAKENVIFIGDSLDDIKSAKTAGIKFIGRINPQLNKNYFVDMDIPIVNDFKNFKKILDKNNH